MATREMITDPQDFFDKGCGRCDRFDTAECSTKRWHAGLIALRKICLDAGLEETAKWGHPCYMRGDRNIALISAFREDFRLTFMNAALLEDPEGLLEKNGPNTQHASVIRFTADDQVAKLEPTVRAYLEEAIGYADRRVKPKKEIAEFELPEELVDALDADPELAEAFEDLTPGRQRSYVINLNGAKQSSTRLARIAKFRDKIIAGKGAQEY
ncbi:YdeI/OmpD-associated family protein [Croceibacterium aestuarii]|uniref:YdeI/OmpD-associated family protein n=1 Tax=Croceibacterium aestuarii TaxID=3064139 RepID=UPI00272E48CD|nr:YdeI/OmpD-associated family protein [Croceibacterium sp. D39]